MQNQRSRRRVLLAAILAIVLAGSSYGIYAAFFAEEVQAEEPELQTTVVRQGDIVLYASGSGTLIASEEIELGFGTSGAVAELHVSAGDRVVAGDVLAVQADREQLEAAVATDQLTVLDAQEALDSLYQNAELAAAQAQLDLANAQDVLEVLPPCRVGIADANALRSDTGRHEPRRQGLSHRPAPEEADRMLRELRTHRLSPPGDQRWRFLRAPR